MSVRRTTGEMAALANGAATLGIPLDDIQLRQFASYRDMLLEWTARVNLTAITDPAEVLTRHFLDSLTCMLALPHEERALPLRLLDVGSGAGFPGLALAIARPAWHVTTLEATGKKVRFQQAVIAALGLTSAEALAGRAEELAHSPVYRSHFDIVTARALASLPTLLEFTAPFTRLGGRVIAPKKGELTEEIAAGERAARLLGARLLDPISVTVPPLNDGRVLLVAVQERPCPRQYPRAAGAPLKRPLGT